MFGAIATLTTHTAEPVRMDHNILAIEDGDKASSCDEVCVKLLATSNHGDAACGRSETAA